MSIIESLDVVLAIIMIYAWCTFVTVAIFTYPWKRK